MFLNAIRKIGQQQFQRWCVHNHGVRHIANIQQQYKRYSSDSSGGDKSSEAHSLGNMATQKSKSWEDDVSAGLRIEAELFEKSSIKHEPIAIEAIRRRATALQGQAKPKRQQHAQQQQSEQKAIISKKRSREPPTLIDDSTLGLQFYRLKLGEPLVSELMTTVRSRKKRDKHREIVIEGRRLILEAIEVELKLLALLFSQKEQLELIKDEIRKVVTANPKAKIYKVPQHDLKLWSTLSTPPGLLAIFERPAKVSQTTSGTPSLPITVICDNIREPNNLGSIIRICAALPCQQVIVTRGCCDPWASKALRGGCGGQFRLPIYDDADWAQLPELLANSNSMIDLRNCNVYVAENNWQKLNDLKTNVKVVDYSEMCPILNDTAVLDDEIPQKAHNVVVIGGESHGVSHEAYEFLRLMGARGECVNIPVAKGMDSLNVASALTLILYELRKHLLANTYD